MDSAVVVGPGSTHRVSRLPILESEWLVSESEDPDTLRSSPVTEELKLEVDAITTNRKRRLRLYHVGAE